MMFCPKCKALLMPKMEKTGAVLVCSCGYRASKGAETMAIREERKSARKELEVIEKEIQILPKTDIVCPKCKHKEAFWWEQQIRAADEPATRFYKCAKCSHTWRDLKSG